MRAFRLGCLLLTAGFCTAGIASDTIYQWKDADGVVHSSDKPPAHRNYEVRQINQRNTFIPSADPVSETAMDPQCTAARENLRMLNSDMDIRQDTDGDGVADKTLNESEREAQKTLAEAAIKAYCPPSASTGGT